ncbi:MAG: hypothetical protein MK101_08680 [Phycisphaerales bacterium]|nr:hypothetical protein [Phycisphaerales bacterium]
MSITAPKPDKHLAAAAGTSARRKRSLYARMEAFISRLSTKNNFWHRVCSLIWLPYAWRSGISIRREEGTHKRNARFRAILPFRRFNRNWYNAMAGAALLGNSEVAGGMFLFAECGSDYQVVCKNLNYRFLRPCHGPAVYEVADQDNLRKQLHGDLAQGGEFNIDVVLQIQQAVRGRRTPRRVGECTMTFHCTPKTHAQRRRR